MNLGATASPIRPTCFCLSSFVFGYRAWTEGLFLISFLPQNTRSVTLAPCSSFLNVLSKRRRRWFGQFPVPFHVLPNSFLPVLRRVQRGTSGNVHHGC